MDVLFLCTGNYYRSRFAELYFNHLATQLDLRERASSRGLEAWAGRNPGPISAHAVRYLLELGIPLPEPQRLPMQLTEADWEQAERVIALDEDEHRQMVLRDFPNHIDRVEFWRYPDTHLASPLVILPAICIRVEALCKGE